MVALYIISIGLAWIFGKRRRIEDYLGSRVEHSKDALKYNFGDVEDARATWRRLGLGDRRLAGGPVLQRAAAARMAFVGKRAVAIPDPPGQDLRTVGHIE